MQEINSLAIINYYRDLEKKDKIAFREQVMDMTGLAYTSFYNKINGKTEFSKSQLYVISNIITHEKD